MKRYLILVTLIVSTISVATAQMEVGVRGGFLTSSRSFKPDRKSSNVANTNYGLIFTCFGQKYLGVQIEAALTQRGGKYMVGDSAYKLTQQMVELPIMSQARISYKGVSLLLNVGPYFGYVLNQTEDITYQGVTTTTDIKFIKTYDRRFQYGLTGGPGVNVLLGPIAVQGEVRYYYGLSHLYNPAADIAPAESQETGLGVFVGIMYRFK